VSGQAPRRLWLVRHGETEGQSSIRYHGSNDVRLSDEGRAQIRALAPLLAGVDFAQVVHSPLQRAAESAAILGERLGLPRERFVVDERLREISFGDCEGMTAEEIAAAHPEFWSEHRAGRADAFPGGESRAHFAARVRAAIRERATGAWAGDLLVVAHRGIVRHGLHALLGEPGHGLDPYAVALGSVSIVRDDGGWRLEAVSLLP
jgi:broad specificity phosphatase PhoE